MAKLYLLLLILLLIVVVLGCTSSGTVSENITSSAVNKTTEAPVETTPQITPVINNTQQLEQARNLYEPAVIYVNNYAKIIFNGGYSEEVVSNLEQAKSNISEAISMLKDVDGQEELRTNLSNYPDAIDFLIEFAPIAKDMSTIKGLLNQNDADFEMNNCNSLVANNEQLVSAYQDAISLLGNIQKRIHQILDIRASDFTYLENYFFPLEDARINESKCEAQNCPLDTTLESDLCDYYRCAGDSVDAYSTLLRGVVNTFNDSDKRYGISELEAMIAETNAKTVNNFLKYSC
jgi:tetratricopeptide (TPR) repeat protein